jgi:hypothetical protein
VGYASKFMPNYEEKGLESLEEDEIEDEEVPKYSLRPGKGNLEDEGGMSSGLALS